MAVAEAFDLLGFSIGDIKPVEDDRFDSIRLFIGDAVEVDDDVVEPAFATAPFFVEFDEPARLDPKRVGLTWEVPPPVRTGLRPLSSLGALLLHLLPFLLLITWPTTANEGPALIPIQLVIQEPPPPPPAPTPEAPQPAKPPPQGKLASEDMGEVNPKTTGATPTAALPAPAEKQPKPTEPQTTAVAAIPPPVPPPPPPKPAPPKEHAAVQLPKPSTVAAPKAPDPQEAARAAKAVGPAANRDEYLAYLVTLTRQHLDLLPMSVVGTRRGETVVSVAVQTDGTISHVNVAHGSGYPDIDDRIVQMVAAVRKFPPVPQWFQGSTLELNLRLRFPEALE
ncbi:MAG TPA: energy transducer TonB [Stellaceae bacterium]|nr:energy transducer TonB [Stellaceae bacterium]